MKKIVSFLCILSILFVFIGCEESRKEDNSKDYFQIMTYTEGNNKYGNAPYATNQRYRLVTETNNGIIICKDGSFQKNANGKYMLSNIYFIDDNNENHFLTKALTGQISYYDGWIYYSDWNYGNNSYYYCTKLFRIKEDGTDEEIVYDGKEIEKNRFNSFCIANGKIYLNGIYGSVKSMDLDGKNLKEINDNYEKLYNIQVVGDEIYYHYPKELFVSNLDGEDFRCVIKDEEGLSAYVNNNGIYYYSKSDKKLYKILPDRTKETLGKNINNIHSLFIFDEWLFYQYQKSDDEKDFNCMECLNLTTGKRNLVCDDILRSKYSMLSPTLVAGWIYYDSVSDTGESKPTKIDIFDENNI